MTAMNIFLWLLTGASMGAFAGWHKARCGRPRHWLVDVAFAAVGSLLGGVLAVALDASLSHWAALAAATFGGAALLLVAGLRWRRAALA